MAINIAQKPAARAVLECFSFKDVECKVKNFTLKKL